MSKKSRKRNKRILAAITAIGLGMAAKNKRNKAIDAGIQSAEDDKGSAMLADSAVTGTNYPGANKAVVAAPVKTNVVTTGDVLGRMKGSGPESGVIGQNKRADYAKKMREAITGVDGPPSVLNPYRTPRVHVKRGQTAYSKGGSVKGAGKIKGCGKALRGFGKAMKKGKK